MCRTGRTGEGTDLMLEGCLCVQDARTGEGTDLMQEGYLCV